MNPVISIFFDVVILAALGVTIFYCLRLSRQFNEMQANRKAFESLIQSLTVAASRAEAVIRSIKEDAVGSGDGLQEKISRARALFDEMEIMIQAGDNLADRLQVLAEKSRKANPVESPVISEEELSLAPTGAQPKSRAEKELLEAIKAKQQ